MNAAARAAVPVSPGGGRAIRATLAAYIRRARDA